MVRLGAGLLIAGLALPVLGSTPKITETQKIAIIRALVAEVGIARQPLPPDKQGVQINPSGKILNRDHVQEALGDRGNSSKVGDRLAITAIVFKGDRIEFAINGGPHKTHWYDHVAIGMGGTAQPVTTANQTGPHGSMVTLQFPGDVPPLTPEAVKKDLDPIIDFDPPSKAEEMVKRLPASVKAAIDAHHVLVGMDQDMVVAALGRTENKSRENDAEGRPCEDWIYGAPPAQTLFVRFIGGRVARVTTYEVNGTQIVDSTPDPALAAQAQTQQRQAQERAIEEAQPAPTLRRPGDAPPPASKPRGPQAQPQDMPPGALPGSLPPDNGGTPPGFPPTGAPPGQQLPPTHPPVCCPSLRGTPASG
ncbi:MAG TPA: hypothetical protein VN690_12165 [Terriglobales bacterium]|nr:hypothetical protein [Terriglobales bacterium]